MILLHHRTPDGIRLAVRTPEGFRDTGGVTLDDVLAGGEPRPQGPVLDEGSLRLAPAVPNPGKIVCAGLNYRLHAIESGADIPANPILFAKLDNTPAASGEDIPLKPISTQYDYEAELVVVMGRRATDLAPGEVMDAVWGYCNGNDLSARDLQSQSSQWLLGKSLDRFGPTGPWLVSKDEAGDPAAMRITCMVNGDLRQDSVVGDMIFAVPELISFITRHMTLEPGDIVFTGTPSGVADGRPDHPWLVPGDEVVVQVGPLGRLVNCMVSAGGG